MNIAEMVLKHFSAELTSGMATALGIDRAVVDKLVAGGVPALLAGLVGKSSEPDGAKAISSAIAAMPADMLASMADAIGALERSTLIETGRSTIASLLGNGMLGQLAGTLSKFGGTGIGNASSVLGILMPGVLGVLGREQSSRGLDASGLAGLLAAQRTQISDAIPLGLRPMLADMGLLDGLAVRPTAPKVSIAQSDGNGPPATTTANGKQEAARRSAADDYIDHSARYREPPYTPALAGRRFSWPVWLAVIAGSLFIWWSVFGERVIALLTGAPPPSISRFAAVPERLMVGDAELGAEATQVFDMLYGTLTGIRGELTARLSITRLQEASLGLERLHNLSAQLPPDHRRQFAALVQSRMPELQSAIAAAEAAPGTGADLKPVLTALKSRLASLTN